MDEEIEVLLLRKIWSLVRPPLGVQLVVRKWVYTLKYNPDGIVDKYKSQLVAEGLKHMAFTTLIPFLP